MKAYRFLLFDLDYTLLDFKADEVMAFEKLYRAQGWDRVKPCSPDMLSLYDSFNNKWWRKFENKECAKQELFEGRFSEFMEAAGLSGDPAQVNAQYFDFLGTGGVVFPGALELLEKLSETAELYVITNGNAATAKTRIANSGVGRYIRGYFVSEAIGCAKPAREYFDYVAAHIPGFVKAEALVIGDSLLTDIGGAQNAGLDSLWFHPPGRAREQDPSAPCTYTAESFEEIFRLLSDKTA